MKTNLRKYALIGALALGVPFMSVAQYDDNMQPADPGDTVVSPQDMQMDDQEAQQVAPPDQQPQSVQTFYDALSPYGQWVYMNNQGYVWIPNAGVGFVPYSNYGHWVYTDYGWTWVSDYSWGWAPFHYGRWGYDPYYGWYWVPDIYWGPAWVAWRHCDGYYGWAPLGPGMSISVGYYSDYGIPASWWMFVGENYICDRYIWRHYEPRRYCEYYYHHSSPIYSSRYDDRHHISYAAGPRREDVAAVTHSNVRVVSVRPAVRPEQRFDNQHLHIYKPEVQPIERTTPRPQPVHSVPINQVPRRDVTPQPYRSFNGSSYNYQQPARQQYTAPTYTASARSNPAPVRTYSAPAPTRTYSAPAPVPQRSFGGSRPMPAPVHPSGGGGGRGGRR